MKTPHILVIENYEDLNNLIAIQLTEQNIPHTQAYTPRSKNTYHPKPLQHHHLRLRKTNRRNRTKYPPPHPKINKNSLPHLRKSLLPQPKNQKPPQHPRHHRQRKFSQ